MAKPCDQACTENWSILVMTRWFHLGRAAAAQRGLAALEKPIKAADVRLDWGSAK